MGIFHAKGVVFEKFVPSLDKPVWLGSRREGTWDVQGICGDVPGRLGVFKTFVQKSLGSFSALENRPRIVRCKRLQRAQNPKIQSNEKVTKKGLFRWKVSCPGSSSSFSPLMISARPHVPPTTVQFPTRLPPRGDPV